MGHDDHRVLKIDQKFLKPGDRVEIKMVRRLVQKKDIRISEERARQQHLDPLRTRKSAHLRVKELLSDAEAGKQLFRVCLGVPAVHLREFRLKLTCPDSVFVRKIFLRVQCLLLLRDVVKPLVAHDHGVKHRELVIFEMVLLQEGKTLSRRDRDIAGGRLQLAGKNLQKRRLSRAVRADYAVALTLGEFDIDMFKKRLFPDTKRDVIG